LIEENDYNLTILIGKPETEFEDLLAQEVYTNEVKSRFGVDLTARKPRNRNAKWSARMADVFAQAGKPFDAGVKQRLKFVVAEAVSASPGSAIAEHAEGIICSLIESLKSKLS